MSDERGAVELTKKDDAEVSGGTPDTVVRGAAADEQPERLDAADTVEARANYATFAVALGKTAESHSEGETSDEEVPEPVDDIHQAEAPNPVPDTHDVADDSDDDDDIGIADDTGYSGLEEAEVPEADADIDEPETTAAPDGEATPRRIWRRDFWRRQITVKPIPVILVLLLLISGGLATWMYFQQYRPDQLTSQSVARTVINSASEGTVAVLSYSPESLDKDFAGARSHLSGDFLSYYDQFTQQFVAPASKQKALKTTARVMRAAVQELRPTSAVVLLFVDQSTTTKDNPEPSVAARSVLVTLALIDGKWLITKFTPV